MDRYLLAKPILRMFVEWPVLIGTGVLGELFSWARISFSPYSNIGGGVVIIGAWMFHAYCHRAHKQAHQQSKEIDVLVTTGVFSRIRHPMYLSLILMHLGFAVRWGIVWILLPAVVFSVGTVLTAVKEEEFLLRKFGPQYAEYMRKVPWRLIPRIF